MAGWYASYGAVPLLAAQLTLLLRLATVAAALKAAGKYGQENQRQKLDTISVFH